MVSSKGKEFNVYRGLQRPLIFKSLKGKFIYWGMGCLLLSLVSGILLATLVHVAVGAIGLILFALGGMFFILSKQKKGLHDKTRSSGTFIITPQFKKKQSRQDSF